MPVVAYAGVPEQPRRLPSLQNKSLLVHDVQLTADGKLNGQLVDAQGLPLAGETVTLRDGEVVLGQTKSDAKGRFAVDAGRGGTYLLAARGADTPLRVWSDGTAPSAATNGILVVAVEETIRGRHRGGSLLTTPEARALFTIPALIAVGAVVQKDRQDDNDNPSRPAVVQPPAS